jgi:hypothetical protein
MLKWILHKPNLMVWTGFNIGEIQYVGALNLGVPQKIDHLLTT